MRIKLPVDLSSFIRAVQTCDADVYFCTKAGDKLNLKSLLSEYVFSTLILKPSLLDTGWIEAQESDLEKLSIFLLPSI